MGKAGKRRGIAADVPLVYTHETVCEQLHFPAEVEETLAETVALEMAGHAPFEEGDYALGYEVVAREGGELTVWAAVAGCEALGERWHDVIARRGELGKVRLELSLFAWWRGLLKVRPQLAQGRHLVAVVGAEEVLLLVLAHGVPAAVRSLPGGAQAADVGREAMLLVLASSGDSFDSTRCFADDAQWAEVLQAASGLAVTFEELAEGGAEALLAEGLKRRAGHAKATFDLTPESWREEARNIRHRRLMRVVAALFTLLWLGAVGALYWLPKMYEGWRKDVQKQIQKQARAYNDVQRLKERVALIGHYQDRSYSALEMLRLVCVVKAPGVTFTAMNYRQHVSLKLSGLAGETSEIYALKDALIEDPRIETVEIKNVKQDVKTRKHRFDLEILFPTQEAEA